jgi:hypothetical protein
MIVEMIDKGGHKTVIEAEEYKWKDDFFFIYTITAMDFFDKNNIASIVVDGEDIPLPASTGSD